MTKEIDIHHLEKLTVKELREIAVKYPHERAVSEMKKEELIAFIREAMGIKEEMEVHKKKAKVRVKMTKPEVKAKIRELKTIKLEVQGEKDRKKAKILRRRISRLKKVSRRLAGV